MAGSVSVIQAVLAIGMLVSATLLAYPAESAVFEAHVLASGVVLERLKGCALTAPGVSAARNRQSLAFLVRKL